MAQSTNDDELCLTALSRHEEKEARVEVDRAAALRRAEQRKLCNFCKEPLHGPPGSSASLACGHAYHYFCIVPFRGATVSHFKPLECPGCRLAGVASLVVLTPVKCAE